MEQFLAPASYLLLTPLVMAEGEAAYAGWVMAIAFSALSSFVTFGYTGIQVRDLAAAGAFRGQAVKDYEAAALSLVVFTAIVALVGGGIGRALQWDTASWLCTGLFIAAISELDKLLMAGPRSRGHFGFVFVCEATGRIGWAASTLLMLLFLHDDISVLVAGAFLCRTAIKFSMLRAYDAGNIALSRPTGGRPKVVALLAHSRWMLVQLLGGSLITVADRFVITEIAGASFFASYFPMLQVCSLAFTFSAAASSVILSSSPTDFPKLASPGLLALMMFVCSVPNALLYLLSYPIFDLWLGSVGFLLPGGQFALLNTTFMLLAALAPIHFFLLRVGFDRVVSVSENAAGFGYLCFITAAAVIRPELVYVARFVQPLTQLLFYAGVLGRARRAAHAERGGW